MNEAFEAYKQKNIPSPLKTGQTSSGPMEAIANANWLPWPRKDVAKGGKSLRSIAGKGVKFGRNHDRPGARKKKET
jgi:hypothetical protein